MICETGLQASLSLSLSRPLPALISSFHKQLDIALSVTIVCYVHMSHISRALILIRCAVFFLWQKLTA